MKKINILLLPAFLVILSVAAVTVGTVRADDRPFNRFLKSLRRSPGRVFNPDKQLSKSACGERLGNPVIDVVQKVKNDADSGEAGNYWAFDYYNRYIKVWDKGDNHYCAIITYSGNFYAVPGQVGPGNDPLGAMIDSPVYGLMSGGRRATIVGELMPTPLWVKQGNVGTTNYQCNIFGVCPGFVDWKTKYFTTVTSYEDNWWGWQYKGGNHGTWVNSIEGNSGNIL